MHHVPVIGKTILAAVLAHWRYYQTVLEFNVFYFMGENRCGIITFFGKDAE